MAALAHLEGMDARTHANDGPQQAPAEHLLTVPEICARLGISRSTFYDWRQAHKAPPCLVLPNAQIRVRETDFSRWVDDRMETAL